MNSDDSRTWNGSTQEMHRLIEWLGERPGGRIVDPMYIKQGYAGKYFLWNEFTKKWTRLTPGDTIYIRADGSVGLEKRAA